MRISREGPADIPVIEAEGRISHFVVAADEEISAEVRA